MAVLNTAGRLYNDMVAIFNFQLSRRKIINLSCRAKTYSNYCYHIFYLLSVPGMLLSRFTPAVNLLFHYQKHQLHGQFHIYIRVQTDTRFVDGL